MQLELFYVEAKKPELEEETRAKKCNCCGEEYPETEEYFYKAIRYHRKNGTQKQFFHPKCIPCHNKATIVQHRLQEEYGHRKYGKCDCCGVPASELKGGKLHLDHCHQTGEYRGHLCGSCNRGIGLLGDNLSGVLMAVEYMKKVNKK